MQPSMVAGLPWNNWHLLPTFMQERSMVGPFMIAQRHMLTSKSAEVKNNDAHPWRVLMHVLSYSHRRESFTSTSPWQQYHQTLSLLLTMTPLLNSTPFNKAYPNPPYILIPIYPFLHKKQMLFPSTVSIYVFLARSFVSFYPFS